jgi:hypothetical protein
MNAPDATASNITVHKIPYFMLVVLRIVAKFPIFELTADSHRF